jgi:hypothetical protein
MAFCLFLVVLTIIAPNPQRLHLSPPELSKRPLLHQGYEASVRQRCTDAATPAPTITSGALGADLC